jgi:hypothetical protein
MDPAGVKDSSEGKWGQGYVTARQPRGWFGMTPNRPRTEWAAPPAPPRRGPLSPIRQSTSVDSTPCRAREADDFSCGTARAVRFPIKPGSTPSPAPRTPSTPRTALDLGYRLACRLADAEFSRLLPARSALDNDRSARATPNLTKLPQPSLSSGYGSSHPVSADKQDRQCRARA